MTDTDKLRALLREAIPHLRDAAEPYEDDGSNEPLELARRIEDELEAALSEQPEARCAECGAELELVRPGKHQHPTCSQAEQPEAKGVADTSYAECCDTPAYCSSVRRCTAKDACAENATRAHENDDMDALIEAYKQWPADIRRRLSLHDLRRMAGWAPRPAGKWAIDHSAGRPILVYENCSVIEDEQARYVLSLIRRDTAAPEPAGGVPEEVRKLVGRIDYYRLRMSYNESYFGEPVGLLKGVVAELAAAVNAIYPNGNTALYANTLTAAQQQGKDRG